MQSLKFVFGTSNTQPLGSDDETFESIYQRAYKPFVRTLYNHPEIPITLHYSGSLFQWLEKHHSEFIDVLSEMASRKQLEFLGGGFYDPVLPLIPHTDRLGQIERMTTFLRKQFGRRPRGAWLTELVWEPSLPSALRNSGMEYTFLADYHFITAGLSGDDLYRPCITEDQGKTVVVFPICKTSRWKMLTGSPEDMIQHLRELACEDTNKVVVILDEGERLGGTADSYRIAYEEEWLSRFLDLVKKNRDWLEPIHPWRYLKTDQPKTRAYFPSTSYEEMMLWTLPAAQQNNFRGLSQHIEEGIGRNGYLAGGFFRQFLARYPESNLMYAKMQYTHILVNQIRGDKYRKQAAREELWRGQCHSAYWHGPPGGIYRNKLRKQVYSALIEAEKVTRERGVFISSIVSVDFDMDGLAEHIFQGQSINAYLHQRGGRLFELDFLPVSMNYLDTFGRQEEAYHDPEQREFVYDSYEKRTFVDHFWKSDYSSERFFRGDVPEYCDVGHSLYRLQDIDREHHALSFIAEQEPEPGVVIRLEKSFVFSGATLRVQYRFSNTGTLALNCAYGCEANFAFASDAVRALEVHVAHEDGSKREIGPQEQVVENVRELRYRDLVNGAVVRVGLSAPVELWSHPVYSVSSDVVGYVESFQHCCSVFRIPLNLNPGEEEQLLIELSLKTE